MPSKTRDRMLDAATRLFAERGYDGTSVRAICERADTNVNAVAYHFGGKQALYEAVMERWGDALMASAERILGEPPKDGRDLETRLLLFTRETLAAHLASPDVLIICFNEWQSGFRNSDGTKTTKNLVRQNEVLVAFLDAAKRRRLLRKGVDTAIVAGALFERISNQVRYADAIETVYGTCIKSPSYLLHWTEQTVDLLLYGAARAKEQT